MTTKNSIKILTTFLMLNLSIFTSANATAAGAEDFVKQLSDKVIELVKNKNENELIKDKQLSKLFEESVDTQWISKFVMGNHWKDASETQKRVYLELYRKFLLSNYIPKLKSYANQEIKFKNVFDEGENEYLIETSIVQPDGSSVNVDYKVRKYGENKYLIFDVIAEGVSLITTQRSEFASILSRKGVDYLIKKLKMKV
jgi:phospholipid transport system substrate-binding protein